MAAEILLIAISNIDLPAVKEEVRLIRDESLKHAQNQGYIKTDEKTGINYNALAGALSDSQNASQITMLHYTGHSDETGIVVEVNNRKEILGLEALNTLIKTHRRGEKTLFRFVFLNSCYSEEIAKAFTDIGVPFVIGSIGKVNDEDAAKVSSKFYEILGSTPKTIKDAYDLTNKYFIENPNELSKSGKFRSLVTGKFEERNVWKFFASEKITEEQKEWTLIKDYKYVLSHDINSNYQLKVLCLYQKKHEEYYRKIKAAYLDETKKRWLLYGIWELFEGKDFNISAFKKEFDAAGSIIHLIGGNDYLTEAFKVEFLSLANKNNAWIPIGDIDEVYFSNQIPTFSKFSHLSPKPDMLGKSLEEILENMKVPNIEKAIKDYFQSPIYNFLDDNYVDAEDVKKGFKDLKFTEESAFEHKYRENIAIAFSLIAIRSSPECAQALLIRKIIKIAKPLNTVSNKVQPIDFEIISKPLDFWKTLAKTLNIYQSGNEKLNYLKNECIRMIIRTLKPREEKDIVEDQNIYIVCQNLKISLIKEVKKLFDELAAQSTANLTGKFLFFIVTNTSTFSEELEFEIEKPKAVNHRFKEIKPMLDIDINDWENKQKKYANKIIKKYNQKDKKNNSLVKIIKDDCPSELRRRPFVYIVYNKLGIKENEAETEKLFINYD